MQTDSPPTPQRARLKWAAACVFGLGLLAWLLHKIPLDQVKAALRQPEPAVWLITLAGLLGSYVIRGARLQVVLGLEWHQATRAPRTKWLGLRLDALRVILMHNAAVNLLPMRAGELSFPWLASRELGMPVARAVACLLWMRIQDLAVLLLAGLLVWPGLPLSWRGAGVLAAIGGWFALKWALPALQNHTRPASGLLTKLSGAMAEPAHHRPAAWLLTAANWTLKLSAGACLLSAITQASWRSSWLGALGGELAAVVPLQGPAGFGTYEAGVWAAMATQLPASSAALGQAVVAALALHVCFLICAVVAGLAASGLGQLKPSPASHTVI